MKASWMLKELPKKMRCERWKEREFDEGSRRKWHRKQEERDFDENFWWESQYEI